MPTKPTKPHRSPLMSSNTQLLVGFVIPTIILLYFSDESRLGPLPAMLLALLPPIVLELYSLRVRRKPSLLSILAIIGILSIGLISLLGLSEQWLAVRRSFIYIIAAVGLVIAMHFKRNIIDKALTHIITMDTVHAAAQEMGTSRQLARLITKTGYAFAALLLLIGAVNYIITIVFITAATGTSEFNAEYARLRLLSIAFITAPLLIGTIGLLTYLLSGIKKLTCIKTEDLLKKK